jgi:uncharacterized membrane protein
MFLQIAGYTVLFLEGLGTIIIVGGIVGGFALAIASLGRGKSRQEVYRNTRHQMGAAILLGLEVLIGADIIRTITLDFTLESVGALAAIVLVRTFISLTLEVEMTGHWPWQGHWRERDQGEKSL